MVRWVEPVVEGGAEPEYPAHTLRLIDAAKGEAEHGATTEEADDETTEATLAIVALVPGAVGALVGAVGFARAPNGAVSDVDGRVT